MVTKLQPAAPSAATATTTRASIRSSFHSVTALLITALVLSIIYLSRDAEPQPEEANGNVLRGGGSILSSAQPPSEPPLPSSAERCDLFSGRWVYDNVSYPLYKEQDCKFMSDQVACEKFGRTDLSYRHWRWQPDHCDLPRFNATAMLEKLRNKRMVFVGDSLNRGQWVSMICLVESAIANSSLKSMHYHLNGSLITFQAQEYNASIDFYWAPLLVESNCDYPWHHSFPDRIIQAHAIAKHAQHWSDADFLIFDTYQWWRQSEMNVLWGAFDSPDGIYKNVSMPRAIEMALNTWADWLEIHVNKTKTQMFFMSSSPTHVKAKDWGGVEGQKCYQETGLITDQGYRRNGSDPEIMQTVKSVVKSLETRGVSIKMINITRLSEYRKDGHPSIHRRFWKPLSEEEKANPVSYADCTHWCLPGVPDVWNVLLYAHIFQNQTSSESEKMI